ncbi:NUDIX hydrolase [Glycomyces sp. NPDC047369]
MRFVRLPAPVLRAISPVMRWWWRIRKPTTFGVKVLLLHPDEPTRFLVARHSYADTRRWGLPGGGFRPERETPQQAAAREVGEELGIAILSSSFTVLDTVATALEAKRDTLTILTASSPARSVRCSPELAEARWISNLDELGEAPVSRWLRLALQRAGMASDTV